MDREHTAQKAQGRRLLLHACCGPCSIVPFTALLDEGWDITVCYINPNIQPREEYEHRLRTLRTWAGLLGIPVMEGPCDTQAWEEQVAPLAAHREARCEACYRLRLRAAADIARDGGFDAMATTLAVSPYQLLDACNRQLCQACGRVGVEPVTRDYRQLYPEAVRAAREANMYRQNYCGCRYSAAESALQRSAARVSRQLDKNLERARTMAQHLEEVERTEHAY